MPWLMKEVKKEMGNMIESRELLMGKYLPSRSLRESRFVSRLYSLGICGGINNTES